MFEEIRIYNTRENEMEAYMCYDRIKAAESFQKTQYEIINKICMPLEVPITEHLDKVADAS